MIQNLKIFFKISIVYFVIISGLAGYGLGHTVESEFNLIHLLLFVIGTFFISAGSLSLNQIQEFKQDKKMDRTQNRPLVTGDYSVPQALSISISCLALGHVILYFVSPLSFWVGFSIVFLYNVFYTMFWKKHWVFAAVPGAIPGALPPVMGYVAINDNILSSDCWYLFLIMFLWQMPHFWSLAIKYREDYGKGSFPVLPFSLGPDRTKYHISFYVFAYVLLAIMSPFFVPYSVAYFMIVLPFALITLYQFLKFFKSEEEKAWLPFFLITNFSMLAFIYAPVVDKWLPLIFKV